MFSRHSEALESPGEEQRSVLLSYFIVMIFPVSEGEQVMFQPVLTPQLAVALKNSCPGRDAFCCGCLSGCVPQAALALLIAPVAASRRRQGVITAPLDQTHLVCDPLVPGGLLVFVCHSRSEARVNLGNTVPKAPSFPRPSLVSELFSWA